MAQVYLIYSSILQRQTIAISLQNKLVVLTTAWLPWLQTSVRDYCEDNSKSLSC